MSHNQGSYQAIIGDAIARHENDAPIIYCNWVPYWVSGVLVPGKDVEGLSVPYTSLPDGNDDSALHCQAAGFNGFLSSLFDIADRAGYDGWYRPMAAKTAVSCPLPF